MNIYDPSLVSVNQLNSNIIQQESNLHSISQIRVGNLIIDEDEIIVSDNDFSIQTDDIVFGIENNHSETNNSVRLIYNEDFTIEKVQEDTPEDIVYNINLTSNKIDNVRNILKTGNFFRLKCYGTNKSYIKLLRSGWSSNPMVIVPIQNVPIFIPIFEECRIYGIPGNDINNSSNLMRIVSGNGLIIGAIEIELYTDTWKNINIFNPLTWFSNEPSDKYALSISNSKNETIAISNKGDVCSNNINLTTPNNQVSIVEDNIFINQNNQTVLNFDRKLKRIFVNEKFLGNEFDYQLGIKNGELAIQELVCGLIKVESGSARLIRSKGVKEIFQTGSQITLVLNNSREIYNPQFKFHSKSNSVEISITSDLEPMTDKIVFTTDVSQNGTIHFSID